MALVGSELTAVGSVLTAAGEDSPGAGPPVVVPTLKAVYDAGASDPKTKDLMSMLSGTTARFQANTDANPLPLVGIYETAASKPLMSSGYPSFGQSLATDLGVLIGGRIFNWFEMFDPNWNGTLAQLAAYTWHADTCSFQQQPSTAWRRNNVFAARDYSAAKNWQPQATPAGPLGSGPATTLHQTSLYNTSDPGLRLVDQLDGYGQTLKELTPIQNGVIYERAIHYSNRLIVPAANDGVGLAVYNGDLSHGGDVPQAVFDFRTVGATAAGDWYAAIALRDTAGDGLLHDVVTLARTGITFLAPVTLPAAQQGVQAAYTSALLDFTAAADNIAIPIPQRAGFIFVARLWTTLFHDGAGTATGSLVWSLGNNAAHNNAAQASISAATINANIAVAPQPSFGNGGGTSPLLDSTTQVVIKIATGVTGVTSLHGYISVTGFWVPA